MRSSKSPSRCARATSSCPSDPVSGAPCRRTRRNGSPYERPCRYRAPDPTSDVHHRGGQREMTIVQAQTRSARLHDELPHPVIDSDAHLQEFTNLLRSDILEEAL